MVFAKEEFVEITTSQPQLLLNDEVRKVVAVQAI
jgi:hypothetical protein